MAEGSSAAPEQLRSQKVKLIDILSADADFLLQHADARALVSAPAYKRVKALSDPCAQVRDVLDHVLQRGPGATQGLLDLLESPALQENFPLLKDLKTDAECSGGPAKRKSESDSVVRSKRTLSCSPAGPVTEKQLMKVARVMGHSWKVFGRLALEIPSVKLEQVEEDHRIHVERVFAMLCLWRSRQRDQATAANLHVLLMQDDWAAPDDIDFLLETD